MNNTTITRTDAFTNKGRSIATAIVCALHANGIGARIDTTYLDFGQNWMWETVIIGSGQNSYQGLNPRQFKDMNDGSFDFAEINEIVATAKKLVR